MNSLHPFSLIQGLLTKIFLMAEMEDRSREDPRVNSGGLRRTTSTDCFFVVAFDPGSWGYLDLLMITHLREYTFRGVKGNLDA